MYTPGRLLERAGTAAPRPGQANNNKKKKKPQEKIRVKDGSRSFFSNIILK